jgi:glycerol-3-phosphate dehydrogenase
MPHAVTPPPQSRARAFDTLARGQFDVVVIGGGINGAAIARDAAMRGLRVALVERDDFASGTSSRSSRLIHGGLRYLEHGYFHLVFESSRERRLLLALAPHLVRPLAFTWPVYRGARVPRWKLAAGLLLYDALSMFRNVGRHRNLGRAKLLAREPSLATDGLRGGAVYYDAATDDTRLTLANALGAESAGATVMNHAPARAIATGPDGFHVDVEDRLTGRRATILARVVVNATGPWTDSVNRMAGHDAPSAVRGTKGAHIAVPRERIGNRDALTILSPLDGRVMFVLPAGINAIVGTTDTPTTSPPDEVRASEADVAYLVASANAFFPEARLQRRDVISAWAGVRPLIAAGYGSAATSASREHALSWTDSGMVSITGGKLTAYRAIAAEVVDAVEVRLAREVSACTTDRTPLPGGDIGSIREAISDARRLTDDEDVAARLVAAYGSGWGYVWIRCQREPALGERVSPELPYIMAEVSHAVEHERACTLADLLVRRMHVAYETRDNGRTAARRIAPLVGSLLGWDDAETRRQLDDYDAEAARLFAVDPVDR